MFAIAPLPVIGTVPNSEIFTKPGVARFVFSVKLCVIVVFVTPVAVSTYGL